ncbi:MAG: hypothetical protein OWS03_08355 [Alicyclobacillaceae bacterium]|nr:hypothetical protein [Alicyclobacillaceae bacterium]
MNQRKQDATTETFHRRLSAARKVTTAAILSALLAPVPTVWAATSSGQSSAAASGKVSSLDAKKSGPEDISIQVKKYVAVKKSTYGTRIRIDGKVVESPRAFAQDGTTYMPIWYVMQSLKTIGIQSTWNGKTWMLVPSYKLPKATSKSPTAKGSMSIVVDKHVVERLTGIVGMVSRHEATTYMPIWYVMQALKALGIESTWSADTWTLKPTAKKSSSPTRSAHTGGKEPSSGTSGSSPSGSSSSASASGTQPAFVPPTLPANEVSVETFVSNLLQAEGVAGDSTGKSPYIDLPTSSPFYPAMNKAMELGIWTPSSSTMSGAYTPVTVSMADQMYWSFLGLSDPAFQPGGNPVAWANIVGFNPPGVQATADITPSNLQTMMVNLANEQAGFAQSGSTDAYQVVYPPENEAIATFAGDSLNGQPFFTSNQAVQTAIDDTYHFYDGIQVTIPEGEGTWTVSLPAPLSEGEFAVLAAEGMQYSTDGGVTYHEANRVDTLRVLPAGSATGLTLKLPIRSELTVSYNQLLPSLAGSTTLGDVSLRVDASGQLVVHRRSL